MQDKESLELIVQTTIYGELCHVREQEVESYSADIEGVLSSFPSELGEESRIPLFYDPGGSITLTEFNATFESDICTDRNNFTGTGISPVAALDDTEIELRDLNLIRIQPVTGSSIPSFEPRPR
jgi:hypothetical protein